VLDQCEELKITPLAYSPVGGGWLSGRREVPADHGNRETIERTVKALRDMGEAYGGATPTQLALAWVLRHPAGIIPLVGSNNPEHIREAAGAASIELSRTDWYKLWVAARGERVP
jgi:predicted oxidoreductase